MEFTKLKHIHTVTSHLLDQTDTLLNTYYTENIHFHYKGQKDTSTSLVTKADIKVEKMIKKVLKKEYPEIGFICEEDSSNEIKKYNWIIDPLDGTLNFASRIPIFGTSISLWKNNEPLYTINSIPFHKERVHAFKDQGIFLNDKSIKRKPIPRNADYFVYSNIEKPKLKLDIINQIIDLIPFPRYLGSSVYHGLLVALGRVDGAIFINNGIWDIAGAILLAQESGLTTHFLFGSPNIEDSQVRNYKHSLIIGEKDIVGKIVGKIENG